MVLAHHLEARRVGAVGTLALLAVVGFALPARADLSLSWFAVQGAPGSQQAMNIACGQPDTSYRLIGTFTPTEDVPDFVALEATVAWGYEVGPHEPRPPLSPFWHFEIGGCAAGAILVGDAMPAGTGLPTPWGAGGGSANVIAQYAPDTPFAGIGQLKISVYRFTPTSLVAGQPYFAFTSDLLSCFVPTCTGCSEAMRVVFLEAHLERQSGTAVTLTPSGLGFSDACINTGGSCGVTEPRAVAVGPESAFQPVPVLAGPCSPTAALPSTWGALKIRYR